MSSNCPPQLHLTLPANTTSFKRSFDQFGFDLESPVGAVEAGGSRGSVGASSSRNERNKRARSASSLSDGNSSMSSTGSSTLASSSNHSERSERAAEPSVPSTSRPMASNLLGTMPFEPPRLPTPDIQDIEMPDYPLGDPADESEDYDLSSPSSSPPSAEGEPVSEEGYRSSHERVDVFQPSVPALRSLGPRSPSIARLPTPPPTLPPLSLQDDPPRLDEDVLPFLNTRHQTSPSRPHSFEFGSNLSTTSATIQRPGETGRNERSGISLGASVPPPGESSRFFPELCPIDAILAARNLPSSSLSLSSSRSSLSSQTSNDASLLNAPSIGYSAAVDHHPQPQGNANQAPARLASLSNSIISDAQFMSDDDLSSLGIPSSARMSPEYNALATRDAQPQPSTRSERSVTLETRSTFGSNDSIWSGSGSGSESPWRNLSGFTPWGRNARRSPSPTHWSARATDRSTPVSSSVPDDWVPPLFSAQRIPPATESNAQLPSTSSNTRNESMTAGGSRIYPLTLRRQSSLGSLSTELERWFENSDTRDMPPQVGAPQSQSDRLSNIPSYAGRRDTGSTVSDPQSSTREFDFESTVSGLRAHVLENARSQQEFPPPGSNAARSFRPRSPPSLASMLVREGPDRREASAVHTRGDNSRRLIEQGLVDPREATGRYRLRAYEEPEEFRPSPMRWSISWADEDWSDEEHLSESERIYQTSRRMGSSAPRPLQPSDRELASWTRRNPTAANTAMQDHRTTTGFGIRRIRPRYASGHGASNSLLSESSAEMRRRHDREIVDRMRRNAPSAQEPNAETGQASPMLPQYPSPGPPAVHNTIAEYFLNDHDEEERLSSQLSRNIQRNSLGGQSQPTDPHIEVPSGRDRSNEWARRPRMPFIHYSTPSSTVGHRPASGDVREHQYDPASRVRDIRTQWNSSARAGRASLGFGSTGIHEPQSSTIPDVPRTNSQDIEPTLSRLGDLESSLSRRIHRDSRSFGSTVSDRRSQPTIPPSIPPPDLGETLFDSSISPAISDDGEFDGFLVEPYLRSGTRGDRPAATLDVEIPLARSPSPLMDIEGENWINMPSYLPNPSIRARSDAPTNNVRPAAERHGNIDLQSYVPGPYRNTLQRFVERGRANERSNPPSIPPLPFESEPPLESGGSGVGNNPVILSSTAGLPCPLVQHRVCVLRTKRRIIMWQPRQSEEELHRWISNHARVDASLLDESNDTSSEQRGLEHALHVLRHDGLSEARSQHIIDQYHRERYSNNGPPRSASLWGSLEDNEESSRPRPVIGVPQRWPPRGNRPTTITNTGETIDYMASVAPLRRRAPGTSPTRQERAEMQDTRPQPLGRGRSLASRFGRNRRNDFESYMGEQEFVNFTELVNPRRRGMRGNFTVGDFMRDEDFDTSYESLLSLEAALGEVKSKATPQHIIEGLETVEYKEWATADSDKRCPICLDDYKSSDPVSKLPECSHWLHKPCLEQWLKSASTCPVCRESVRARGAPSSPAPLARFHSRRRDTNPDRRRGLTLFGSNSASAGPSNSNNSNPRRNPTEDNNSSNNNGPTPRGPGWRFSHSNSAWRTAFGPRPPPDPNA
ncbi:hypothetical protein VNI00_000148 [Paramarasmius palmivorus]|uniref:RING-type domain-containing protein n=1 Tax=Paramarasmius palmivorus TaxID=297713 RepID=A0AAW0ECM5_9AGAR